MLYKGLKPYAMLSTVNQSPVCPCNAGFQKGLVRLSQTRE